MNLKLKDPQNCRYDQISMGEVMLRLDPGESRVRCARSFHVYEGGGEYNVARALRKCFGMRTAVLTALADNDIGYLIEELMLAGGVDLDFLRWMPFDGIGREIRNGLNFTERGFGLRGALGVSDRANSAASKLGPGAFDWDEIFGKRGCRWFHTGGIFSALSAETSALVIEALKAAKSHGVVTSYDLNYRPSLWKAVGGQGRAREVNRAIAPLVDVMIGNEEDFTACLGFDVPESDPETGQISIAGYTSMLTELARSYPNFKLIATSLRGVHSATDNDWSGLAFCDGTVYQSRSYCHLEVFDRVGGGDGFASGLIYGLMRTADPGLAVEYGAAHGALAMTTPGDTSMARAAEVEKLMKGGNARVQR